MSLTIGELASASGVQVETIRYYESIKIMPKPKRSTGKQRRYAEDDVKRLAFIRHARELGFDVSAIRDILGMANDRNASCASIDSIAQAHLDSVEEKIASLKTLRKELKRMLHSCSTGKISDCHVIEVLYDHAKCTSHQRTTRQKKNA